MHITLFDAAQQVRDSLGKIDPETGELIETYTESRALFAQGSSGTWYTMGGAASKWQGRAIALKTHRAMRISLR